ncbi:MAG TPA: GlsB/YeaQ/YmgE family stress response membrane protein [Verrucomicrobiae bacterium]|nr:GlsB/YeaQ/YmgE family stress response membrane protein [Verrucomicrobiae bacterium]
MNWLWFILIGLVAGFLAGAVVKGRGFGFLGNIIIGVIGAVLGGFLFNLFGLAATNLLGNLISAFVGAVVLLLLLGIVNRKGR